MLSESFVRREEPPSFFLFPLEGRSRHFSQKGKRKKRREHRNPSSRRKAFPVGGREKEKKEKSERKESSCLPGSRPWEKSEEKRRGSPFFGAVLPFCRKRGTPPDAESGRKEKGSLLRYIGEYLLLPFFPKKEKKKRKAPSFPCRPSFFRMFPLLHSSKRREAASHRYAGCSKRC